jgi:hypothetical protein
MGGALLAIIVSSALGIVLLWVTMLALQVPWPPLGRLAAAPPSAWLGGCWEHLRRRDRGPGSARGRFPSGASPAAG